MIPSSLDNILNELEIESILPPRYKSRSDFSVGGKPNFFSPHELNNLARDLGIPQNAAELSGLYPTYEASKTSSFNKVTHNRMLSSYPDLPRRRVRPRQACPLDISPNENIWTWVAEILDVANPPQNENPSEPPQEEEGACGGACGGAAEDAPAAAAADDAAAEASAADPDTNDTEELGK
ncbi:hypothetical protein TNCV_588911 [Trichonephila clavipes]|nr:hypothetical protein TNCV_588911 [Trichonephila clavipes]